VHHKKPLKNQHKNQHRKSKAQVNPRGIGRLKHHNSKGINEKTLLRASLVFWLCCGEVHSNHDVSVVWNPLQNIFRYIRVIFYEVFIMCDFNIIVVRNAVREQIMNAVAKIVVDGSSIQLTGIFGETMTIEGTIKEINVSRSEILVIQK
jgi:uncharacterized protein